MDYQLNKMMTLICKVGIRITSATVLAVLIMISGCKTTGTSSVAVGPSVGPSSFSPLGEKKSKFVYNSNIFLDVAVPVFNPGIPEDYNELTDEGIWPQLRRAESNRFALMTKKAIENTGAFGNVSVVPTPQATADLYILGRIDESNSEDIKVTIETVDITGRKWFKKSFKQRVSLGFYRDKKNKGKDPYQPVFDDIAKYVYKQLKQKSEKQKTEIQHVTSIRFSQSFSPETFSKHISTSRKGYVSLVSLPSADDPMLKRVQPLRVQDQLFIDRIQLQYEGFNEKTDDSYKLWQKESLPAAAAAREAENKAVLGGIFGGLILAAGAASANNSSSTTGQVASGAAMLGGAYLIKESFGDNAEAKVHRATIDELGESLDIEMDPHVMSLEDKTVELKGSAEEQYLQWKAHLKRIYELEDTPDRML